MLLTYTCLSFDRWDISVSHHSASVRECIIVHQASQSNTDSVAWFQPVTISSGGNQTHNHTVYEINNSAARLFISWLFLWHLLFFLMSFLMRRQLINRWQRCSQPTLLMDPWWFSAGGFCWKTWWESLSNFVLKKFKTNLYFLCLWLVLCISSTEFCSCSIYIDGESIQIVSI